MSTPAPPRIFSPSSRLAARRRMAAIRKGGKAAQALSREMAADAIDRISFIQSGFATALVLGDTTRALADYLDGGSTKVTRADPSPHMSELAVNEEQPLPGGPYNLIVSLGLLDTVNDLPGALVLMRRALAQGGFMLASFSGAGSLPHLRAAMLAADGERPAPRIHPQVDVRAAGQLMNRLGFEGPVVDGWGFDIAFQSLDQLVGDLRAQAATNVLTSTRPMLGKSALDRARDRFMAEAGPDGLVRERFEIITLSGWSAAPPAR